MQASQRPTRIIQQVTVEMKAILKRFKFPTDWLQFLKSHLSHWADTIHIMNINNLNPESLTSSQMNYIIEEIENVCHRLDDLTLLMRGHTFPTGRDFMTDITNSKVTPLVS